MPDPTLSEALAEAYSSCPSAIRTLETLELRHPTFVDADGNPTAIRVVRNNPDQDTWIERGGAPVVAVLDSLDEKDRELVGLVSRLEPGAPANGGELVPWIALAFEFVLPEVSASPSPELSITMDNVGRELQDKLEAAALSAAVVEVTYRAYLDIDIDGPQNDPPMTLSMVLVNASTTRAVGRARMPNIANKTFPRATYTEKSYPGLAN